MRTRSVAVSVLSAVALTLVLGTSTACAARAGRLYVRVGPPAPVVAVRPVSPGPRYAWTAGYYRWSGRTYVWVPGRWVLAPRPRAVWVPGRWRHDRHGWYFVEGRWR